MPRYFFSLVDGKHSAIDKRGQEFDSLSEAHLHALRMFAKLIEFIPGNCSPPHRCKKLSQIRHVPERRIQRRSMGVRPQVSNVPEETIQTSSRLATRPTSHRNYFQRGGGSILA